MDAIFVIFSGFFFNCSDGSCAGPLTGTWKLKDAAKGEIEGTFKLGDRTITCTKTIYAYCKIPYA